MSVKAVKDQDAYLEDMRESAQTALDYTRGLSFEQFWDSAMTRDAVAMRLLVIGEAAKHLAPTTEAKLPRISFHQIRGMRNRIAHAYDKLDFREVWKVISHDLEVLARELARYLRRRKLALALQEKKARAQAEGQGSLLHPDLNAPVSSPVEKPESKPKSQMRIRP